MKRFTYLLLALFLIVFEAVPEGLALAGSKTIAGVFEFVYLAVITLLLFSFFTGHKYRHPFGYTTYTKLLMLLGGYVFVRFALFDCIHNLSAGLPLFYIGTTKWYDLAWQWFFGWTNFPVAGFLSWFKFIFLLIGVTWLLKK